MPARHGGTRSTARRCGWPATPAATTSPPRGAAGSATLPPSTLLLEVGIDRIHAHNIALANAFRDGLGLPVGDSAIVSVEAPGDIATRLADAGVSAAVRAGRLRLSFHLYNSDADVEAALRVLG